MYGLIVFKLVLFISFYYISVYLLNVVLMQFLCLKGATQLFFLTEERNGSINLTDHLKRGDGKHPSYRYNISKHDRAVSASHARSCNRVLRPLTDSLCVGADRSCVGPQ